jgi:hypothetical protein
VDLDALLGGGIEKGLFHLFYGDRESGVDRLIHQIIVNSLLPVEKGGWDCKAVYLNCGNYKYERTVLDIKLLTRIIRFNRLDISEALASVYAIPVYSEEQEECSVTKILELLNRDSEVKLLVAHNIAKLFTSTACPHDRNINGRILRFQGVVGRLYQACCDKGVSLVASCRPIESNRWRAPPPEGGRYLRHLSNVIVYLKRLGVKRPYMTAVLLKHPNRPTKRADLTSLMEVSSLGRLTIPFRTMLQEEIDNLKRTFREALIEPERKDAFNSLSKAWTAEQGAMSYSKVPTVLDTLFLTAAVDNRKVIDELNNKFNILKSEVESLKQSLV